MGREINDNKYNIQCCTLDLLLQPASYCSRRIFYLSKLNIVICFQAKKHHHTNYWIKSSLDYHDLFSLPLYRRLQYILLQYQVEKYNWLPSRTRAVQANIINWILCEKNGILQIIFANPINDWWNISLYPLFSSLSTYITTQSWAALFIL